jgi:hypothetical protein
MGAIALPLMPIAPRGRSYVDTGDRPTRSDGVRWYRALRATITLAGWRASAPFRARDMPHCGVGEHRFRTTPIT